MSSLQNMSKSAMRVGKNYIKGYTDVQVKVRDATSNDPWGPSGQQMNELAQLSYNQNDFIEIMEILDKRLNDKGKNWRHVFKSLTLLDYLLHAGSENCVIYFRDNIYVVKTLKEFQYVDEYGKDQGANVRQKAKDITNLLQDEARLREERRSRAHMRERMTGGSNDGLPEDGDAEGRRRRQQDTNRRRAREDEELSKAIEESKRMARENEERIRREAKDEEELEQALKLSREEEDKRIKELEEKNKNALFDDSINIEGPNAYTNGSQQVDMWGNPLVNLNDGFANAALQPQYTSFNPYMQQPQQTGYNPFLQQQMQQQAAMQQQWELQQAAQQYQQLMMQQTAQPQQQHPQQIRPQPTAFGSNNPFANFGGTSQQQQSQHNVPVGDLFSSEPQQPPQQQQEQQQPQAAPAQQPASPIGPPKVKTDQSDRFSELNRLLASGDGIDTFGNTGDLRFGHSGNRGQLLTQQQTGAAAMGQQAFGGAGGAGDGAEAGAGAAQNGSQQQQQPFFQL
ncbi:ENTH-domain-containing protein [Tilletiaria anomala UBC 951]|uniref:ENTH-domain-containing protein n=1 Tax=Tilletiaria anomala (strain ATCC 24038 / CBS 436.72 / UBC 951) TaxID=1037660 RepID=A0A066VUR2_TILAU|nr:ENTH-domain-containing protein [Tilletiaria anomala UBC 951]KDN45452.1 ENTH-domain-containing protein [Tilletiaria anomala UBC 951]